MEKEGKRFSIRKKMYIFVIITVLAVAFGTSAIAFTTEADRHLPVAPVFRRCRHGGKSSRRPDGRVCFQARR